MNQNKPIYFNYNLSKAVGIERGIFRVKDDQQDFNEEGWRIVWMDPQPHPMARQVEFNSASAKVMFVLKYGTGE